MASNATHKMTLGCIGWVLLLLQAASGCGGSDSDTQVDLLAVANAQPAEPERVSYNRDIRPILSDKCFACHGPDRAAREADLRLDQPEDGDDFFGAYSVIERGDPDASELIARVHSKKSRIVMPPPAFNVTLAEGEKELLSRWIEQGAVYESHWAFVSLADEIEAPEITDAKWGRDDLDRFVLARLEQEGVKPNKPASRSRWLRRVTYDLTGLPPSPDEVEAFVNDQDERAYEKVVDRLLVSPHFGEHMAAQWIDLARYADSYGYQSDLLSPTWPWRDWAVDVFNQNLPYDQFVIHQLAGDLLPNPTRDQRLATAFNRLHRMTNEGGSISEEWLNEYAADRVHTFGTAFMGMTFECARCHDHRYDPIEQDEYYQLYAFFNSIDEYGMYHDSGRVPTPSMLLPSDEQTKLWAALQQAVGEATSRHEAVVKQRSAEPFDAWLKSGDAKAELPGLQGHYPLDAIAEGNRLANTANAELPGSTNPANQIVAGKVGKALKFAGDTDASFGKVCGGLQPHDTFTASFWLKLPEQDMNGVVFHRTGGTDVGYHGTDLVLSEGRLQFRMIRFWPGNAIAVQTADPLPVDQWVQVTVTYNAGFSASGMAIYLNGQNASETLRDNLTKYPQHGGEGLTFDHRFRSPSIPGAVIDELRAYNRALTPIEARHLFDGKSLAAALDNGDKQALLAYYLSAIDTEFASSHQALVEANKQLLQFQTGLQEVPVMTDRDEPTPAYNLARGAYDAAKTEDNRVDRGTPRALLPLPKDAPRNRLGLAQWLTDPGHPLTARVAVNRLWMQCFGQGLVATPDNFGLQGALPSHPELLDYLSRDYIDSGWDTKAMLKRIVLSATYRQDSAVAQAQWKSDPTNQLLARGPSRRLSAEQLRDTALAASGLLNPTMGGPPVAPYQPPNLWRESNTMSPGFRQSVGKDLYRRSLYTIWKRTAPMPNMIAFDAPGREVCSAKRASTNTPIQALVLLNDVQFVEACRVLAERVLKDASDDKARLDRMFELLAGRSPDDQERELLTGLLQRQLTYYIAAPEEAKKLATRGEHKRDEAINVSHVAAWTTVAQVILNSDATVWRR